MQGVGANVLGSEEELVRLKEQAIYYLSKKQPDRAYETLKPAELVYAGDAQYNYLLGMAAIDSGHPEDASWAFERVVAVMPHHAGARMDMARAFFQLKDYPRAEKEFQLLQAMNPPESAQKAIAFYLAEIDRLSDRHPKWILSGSAYSAVGYSSNVSGANTAEEQKKFFYEAFPRFKDLPPSLQSSLNIVGDTMVDDVFLEAGLRAEILYRLPGPWSFHLTPEFSKKEMSDESSYSSQTLIGTAGVRWKQSKNDLQLDLQIYESEQANGSGVEVSDTSLAYGYLVTNRFRVGAGVSQSSNDYMNDDKNDSESLKVHVSGSYIFGQYRPIILQGRLMKATEDAPERSYGDKEAFMSLLSLQFIYNQEHIFFTNLSRVSSDYDKLYLSSDLRSETQMVYGLGYLWQLNKQIGIKAQISRTETSSNISLYDMDKRDASVRVNYNF